MKTIVLACVLAAAATAFSMVKAGQADADKPPVIAYVSPQRLLTESIRGRAEASRAQTLQQQRATDLRAKQQGLEATRQQLAQAADAATRSRLQQQEQQQRIELERLTTQAQIDIQNLQRQVNAEFLGAVKGVLDELSKTRHFDLVLSSDSAVMWGKPDLDITAAVIERLNGR